MENIFDLNTSNGVIKRINQLSASTQPGWGKMNVAQMLAHCCVTYDYVYNEGKYVKPKGLKKMLLKLFVKPMVVGGKPYPKNGRTAPDFLITDERQFETEKARLIDFISRTQALGGEHFNQKDSHSFGPLTTDEWNNMFYKHVNHHLNQFGV